MLHQAQPTHTSTFTTEPSVSLLTATPPMERRQCSSCCSQGRQRCRRRPPSSPISLPLASSPSIPRRVSVVSFVTRSPSMMLIVSIATSLMLHGRLLFVVAKDSDHYFCGSTWGDASNNCDDRQPCPSGSDEDCTISGGTCWADTTCDVTLGHGSKFKIQQLLDIPYDDLSNRYFCGVWLAKAMENCSLETHCATSDDCGMGETCWETTCNVQDFVLENIAMALTEEEKKESGKLAVNDERRHNFCGISWVDASADCSAPCLGGEDTDCPAGLTCFGDTTCYYDQDLVPTLSPTTSQPTVPPTPSPMEPTLSPTTYPPTELRLNSDMTKFCGNTWSDAIDNCSPKTHCDKDSDCEGNETCFEDLPGCNLVDLKDKEANGSKEDDTGPDRNDISQSRFCGVDWADAIDNCTLERHCPLGTDDECPTGETCFSYLAAKCNAYDMMGLGTTNPTTTSPTFRPTEKPSVYYSPYPTVTPATAAPSTSAPTVFLSKTPTNKPTEVPTQPFVLNLKENPANLWCGYNQLNANKNCGTGIPCPNADCPNGLECYIVLKEYCYAGIYGMETVAPTTLSTTRAPTNLPTTLPTLTPITAYPTTSPTKPPIKSPTISPTSTKVTESPSSQQLQSPKSSETPSEQPTMSPLAIITQSPTIFISDTKFTEQDSITNIATGNLDSDVPSTAPTGNTAQFALPQLYCSYTYQELATSCSSAQSCHNAPCSSGQYCFSYTCSLTQSMNDAEAVNKTITTTSTIPAVEVAETEILEAEDTVETEPTLEGNLAVEREESTQEESQQQDEIDEEDGEPKYYCAPLVLTDFDMYCGSAVRCNDDNPCPSGQFCIQFDCNQPERQFDYCPWGYSGWYFSNDCQKYYECNSGAAGESHACEEGLLFDRVRQECIHRSMVNQFCNGPDLEMGNSQSKYDEVPMKAAPAPSAGTISPSPSSVGYNDSVSNPSLIQLEPLALEEDDKRFADGGGDDFITTFSEEPSSTQSKGASDATTEGKYAGMNSWEDWEGYWKDSSSALDMSCSLSPLFLSTHFWPLLAFIILL